MPIIAFYSKDATGVFKEMSGKVTSDEVAKTDSTLGLKFDLKINRIYSAATSKS